jgi:phospholipid transport system substrate-binding protein
MRDVATSALGRAFAALAVVFMLGSFTANAATPAESFIQDNVQKGLTILNDKVLSRTDKRAQFQSFLESLTDIHRIAIFTLGPAAKTAASADVDAFVEAFRGYAAAVYEEQLSRYAGQSLKVAGSIQHATGDTVVQTYVVDANGAQPGNADEVDFRVLDTGGKMVVIDASVMGAWLAVQERDQFTAFLAQHGGDVKALAADLTRRAENVRNGTN